MSQEYLCQLQSICSIKYLNKKFGFGSGSHENPSTVCMTTASSWCVLHQKSAVCIHADLLKSHNQFQELHGRYWPTTDIADRPQLIIGIYDF